MTRRRYSRWKSSIRQLLPRLEYLLLVAFLIGIVEALWFGLRGLFRPLNPPDILLAIRDGEIVIVLMAFGFFRVLKFHPLFQPDYLNWLKETPWRLGLPLPQGPIRLTFNDLLIAGSLALLLEDPRELANPAWMRPTAMAGLCVFLQAYTMVLSLATWWTMPRNFAYAAVFLLAFSACLSMRFPVSSIVVLILASLVALYGLSKALALFPWDTATEHRNRIRNEKNSSRQIILGQPSDSKLSPDRVPPAELGWPFGICSPYQDPQQVPLREKILLGLLAGFWLYALMANVPEVFVDGLSRGLLLCGPVFVALGRLVAFGNNHGSPINLAGRILTFRLIIPRHDARFAGPLSTFMVPVVGGLTGHLWLHIPLQILTPTMLTITLWTATLTGPTPSVWKLTAPARLVPGPLNRNSFEELS
ncbi:hypothetical protein GC176_08215 [bacterium]|nr:hypothetical protein [bacterium]